MGVTRRKSYFRQMSSALAPETGHRRVHLAKSTRPGTQRRARGLSSSQYESAQVGVLGEVADVLVHVAGVDLHRLARTVGRREGNIVEHPLHHRLQPPRADVLHTRI